MLVMVKGARREAIQWNGTNISEIQRLCGQAISELGGRKLSIETLSGTLIVTVGDWVVEDCRPILRVVNQERFSKNYTPLE